MISFSDHLQALPRLKGVHQEKIVLDRSFEQTAAAFADDRGTVLLLSGSDSDASQYHILAVDPWLELTAEKDRVTITHSGHAQSFTMDIFQVLTDILDHYTLDNYLDTLPVSCGLFGYFSYDLKDRIEKLPVTCRDTHLPDLALYAPSTILIHNKQTQETRLIIPYFEVAVSREIQIQNQREHLADRLQSLAQRSSFSVNGSGFQSNFTKDEYVDAVNRIIAHLKAGDIYQANFSQRFEAGFKGDAYALFLDLYQRNPAAFFSYIHAGDHHIVSTSPERFIQQIGRHVETRPIKGTIARGSDPETDRENRQALSKSIKDEAELTMIVDLMRNDLSRVTRHESVVVKEHKRIEPYENVFHLVSIVEGELCDGKTSVDLLKATFPGGSITGCPKIRSMEIIDELESVKRHVYTGSIGYISFHDTMDLSIAIRTATIKDNRIWFSVGGGIVYDSDPHKEYQETLDKGKTLMDALAGTQRPLHRYGGRAWVNGKMVESNKADVPLSSLGFQYGAGLFETIKVINGIPLRLDAHVSRLNRSWKTLFDSPVPDITWDRVIAMLIRENGLASQTTAVKLMVARNDMSRPESHFLAATARAYTHRLDLLQKRGLDICTYPGSRHTPMADHKTMNYLFYYQAGQYARGKGFDEAMVLNPDGTVSETNTANIMAVADKTIFIPASDHVLDGVTQTAVLNDLAGMGFEIIRKPMLKEEIYHFPNIILTNALMGAVKVLTIDGKKIKHDQEICTIMNDNLSVLNNMGEKP